MGRPRKKLSLVETFLGPRVLTLPELSRRLNCSRTTVLRRLKEHGYYSSYNHRGTFMTIEEAARFDSHGLWLCKTARFSQRGTLKNTVLHFVQTSREGMTHQELVTLLAVRVHDTLLDVVKEGGIRRQRLRGPLLYFRGQRTLRRKQILWGEELGGWAP